MPWQTKINLPPPQRFDQSGGLNLQFGNPLKNFCGVACFARLLHFQCHVPERLPSNVRCGTFDFVSLFPNRFKAGFSNPVLESSHQRGQFFHKLGYNFVRELFVSHHSLEKCFPVEYQCWNRRCRLDVSGRFGWRCSRRPMLFPN